VSALHVVNELLSPNLQRPPPAFADAAQPEVVTLGVPSGTLHPASDSGSGGSISGAGLAGIIIGCVVGTAVLVLIIITNPNASWNQAPEEEEGAKLEAGTATKEGV